MELGRVGFKERDVADLLTLYGVDDAEERERLLALAREANTPGWWHRYGDVLPGWFQSYLGPGGGRRADPHLRGAVRPRPAADPRVRAGRGRCSATAGASAEEIERRVELRMRPPEAARPGRTPPQLWAVIDEAALRRPIGGRERACAAQLEALIEATELPNVRLQIMPFDAGGHAAAGGAFTILRFPDQDLPDVVYVEQLTSALYLDKRDDVDHYAEAMERLCVEADPPERTADTLRRSQGHLSPARPSSGPG